jgi:soluble lytic murein transglycosylase-like protein
LGSSQQQETASSGPTATIRTYGAKITAAARQFGVDPALSLAIARAESGVGETTKGEVLLNARAVSSAGAVGLFQLMEATGKAQLREIAPGQRYNPLNPAQNIQLGVSYLKEMRETFSENTELRTGLSTTAGANLQEVHRLAVAAYNAGPGRVARAQELARAHGRNPAHYHNIERYLPGETRLYVRKVERFATEFRANAAELANRADSLSTEDNA